MICTKNKTILFIVICQFLLSSIYSQIPFNFRNNEYFHTQGRIVAETESSYIGIGRARQNESDKSLGVYFTSYNKHSGKITKSKLLYIDSIFFYFGDDHFTLLKDSTITIFTDGLGAPFDIKRIEYNFHSDSIIFEKPITIDSEKYFGYLNDVKHNKGNIYISAGAYFYSNSDAGVPILTKITAQNEIRHHIIGDTINKTVTSGGPILFADSNKIFVFGQERKDIGGLYIKITVLDSLINVIEAVSLPQSLKLSLPTNTILLNNDTIMISALHQKYYPLIYPYWLSTPVVFSYSISQKKVLKIQNFNTNPYKSEDRPFHALLKTGNNEVLYGGSKYSFDATNGHHIIKGVIGKVDHNCKEIWRKFYSLLEPSIKNASYYNEIYDIKNTSDGNYICYGEISGYSDELNRIIYESWIFKIDENGNFITIDTTTSIHWIKKPLPITISGNPVGDYLFIMQGDIQNITYHICNSNGQKLRSFHSEDAHHNMQVDVMELSKGLYILRIESNGMIVGSLKFVKI